MRRLNSLLAAVGLVSAVMLGVSSPVMAMGGTSEPSKTRNFVDGERAVQAKDYAKAVPLLERAYNENPKDADTINLLGYSQRKLGNKDVALTYYQRALQANPNHRGANEYLGELYVEMNDLPKAKERLAKLQQVCGTGCEEYRDLKSMIDKAEAAGGTGPRTGS